MSPYAATKIAGEKLCFTYSHLYRIPTICLRFFTVYGPRQRPDLAIRKFIHLISSDEPIPVFGDGSTSRDYTHITDITNGILATLRFECTYEIINLGNSRPVSLRETISAIEQALGKEARIRWLPDQPGDVPVTYADIAKAKRLLGYQPATQLSEGILNMVRWYQHGPLKALPIHPR